MTAAAGKMPKVARDGADITPRDLDSARRYIGVIRTTSRHPMVFFDKVKKADIVAALTAMSWYLDLLPENMGYNYLAAAAHMAKSARVKDLSVVAGAVKDRDRTKLAKYLDGPILDDESVCTSSQWRPPIKGRDEAYSAPDVSVISGPDGGVPVMEGNKDCGTGVDEDDDDGSLGLAPPGGQIPSAQTAVASFPPGTDAGPSLGGDDNSNVDSNSGSSSNCGSSSSGGNSNGITPEGKVSDHSSNSVRSQAAPPKQLAKAGVVGGGLVDKDARGSGVARVGGVGGVGGVDADAVKRGVIGGKKNNATNTKTSESSNNAGWRPRVCNQVWKGGNCNNRNNGCRFAHPTPCTSNRCGSGPSPGCRAFHPRVSRGDLTKKGNGKGGVRRGDAAPKGNSSSNRSRQPITRRNATSHGGGNSSGNNNSRPAELQLRERIELMERRLGLREAEEAGGRRLSYRDVVARGLSTPGGSGSNNNNPTHGTRSGGLGRGGSGLAQPDPAMLSTVVAAVMAVLTGGSSNF